MLILITCLNIVAGWRFASRRGWLSPLAIAMMSKAVFAGGVLLYLDLSEPTHPTYFAIVVADFWVFYVAASYFAGSMDLERASSHHLRARVVTDGRQTMRLLGRVAGVSALIGIAYYAVAGANLLLDFASLDSSDAAEYRFQFSAGNRYLAPGYVNQFKNALLPLATIAIGTNLLLRRRSPSDLPPQAVLFALLGGPFVLVMVAGTGQRLPVAMAACALVLTLAATSSPRRFRRSVVLFGLVFIMFFGFMTSELGRTQSFSLESSVVEVAERLFLTNQRSSVDTFPVLLEIESSWAGDWIQDITSLLPARRPSTISNELFASRTGSTRGTSPPSYVGSVYRNFGWPGVLIFPVAIAGGLAALHRRTYMKQQIFISELVAATFLALIMASWVSGSILTPLNRGLLPVLAIYFWMDRRANVAPLHAGASVQTDGGARHAGRRSSSLPVRYVTR